MPTTTPKLGLVKPFESEFYDISVLNSNMDKIDNLTHIVASGTVTSTRSQVNNWSSNGGTVTWHYKKYSDGTLEADASFIVNDLMCNYTADATFNSGYVQVNYPALGQKSIYHRNVSVGSNGTTGFTNWAFDSSIYGASVDAMSFVLCSLYEETKMYEKVIYVSFKGTWR